MLYATNPKWLPTDRQIRSVTKLEDFFLSRKNFFLKNHAVTILQIEVLRIAAQIRYAANKKRARLLRYGKTLFVARNRDNDRLDGHFGFVSPLSAIFELVIAEHVRIDTKHDYVTKQLVSVLCLTNNPNKKSTSTPFNWSPNSI